MTSQQHADLLLANWQSLWPMAPAERIKRIDEIREECMSENGEPFTPKEEAQIKAELTVRDAWLAVTAASKMYSDPISRPFIENLRDDIMSMRTKIDLLASCIMESDRGR